MDGNLAPAFETNWHVETIVDHSIVPGKPNDWILNVKWAGSLDITPEHVSTLLVNPSYAADCVIDYLTHATGGEYLLCYQQTGDDYLYSIREAVLINNGGQQEFIVAQKEYPMMMWKYEDLIQHEFWGGFHKILVEWSPRPGNRYPAPTWEPLGVLALKQPIRSDIRKLIREQYEGKMKLAIDMDPNGIPTGVGFIVRPRLGQE